MKNFTKITKLLFINLFIIVTLTSCGTESGTDSNQNALNKIVKYAESNGTTETPTVEDYKVAGIQGVNEENIEAVNAEIQGFEREDVDSPAKVQYYLYGTVERDTTIPIISLNGQSTISITQNSDYNDLGARANDNADGDISSNIIVTPNPNNIDTNRTGTYSIVYSVVDSSGNKALDVTRTLIIKEPEASIPMAPPSSSTPTPTPVVDNTPAGDTVKPVITILGDNPLTLNIGRIYPDPGVKVYDDVDGDISSKVMITGGSGITINATTVGDFYITYNATDSAGNKADEVKRHIFVVDNTVGQITNTASVSVNENQTSALTLTSSNISDVRYSISGGDAASFDVNTVSGLVTFKSAPDYEAKSVYTFTATATGSGKTATKAITVNINNIAELPPTLDDATFTVDANAPSGTAVGTITPIAAADRVAATGYALNTNIDGKFAIDASGHITLSADMNSTGNTTGTFTLHATSSLGDSNIPTITINN